MQCRSVIWVTIKSPPHLNHYSLHKIQFNRQLSSGIVPLDITHKLNHKHPRELLTPLLNISHNEVKIPKNTILGYFNSTTDVDTIQEVLWQNIQDTEEKAVKNTAQDPQVHKLFAIFPENSNFQIHANDDSKWAVMLQDAEIPQAGRAKLNHIVNNQSACIIFSPSADFGRTNLVEMDPLTTCLPVASTLYTNPLKYKSFVDEEIKLLENSDCITKSLSHWASPIFWNLEGMSCHLEVEVTWEQH